MSLLSFYYLDILELEKEDNKVLFLKMPVEIVFTSMELIDLYAKTHNFWANE